MIKINSVAISNHSNQASNNIKEKSISKEKNSEFQTLLKKESNNNKEKIKTSNNNQKEQIDKQNVENSSEDTKIKDKKKMNLEKIDNEKIEVEKENIDQVSSEHLFYLINSIIENMNSDNMSLEEIEKLQTIEKSIKSINIEFSNINVESKVEFIEELLTKLNSINNNMMNKDLINIIKVSEISEDGYENLSNNYQEILEDLESIIDKFNEKLNMDVKTESPEIEQRNIETLSRAEKGFNTLNKNDNSKEIDKVPIENNKYVIKEGSNQPIEMNSYENNSNLNSRVNTDMTFEHIDNKVTEAKSTFFDKVDVINQIKEKITFSNIGDMQIAKIKLKPESLGEVSIKLSIRDGNITGRISVENQEIKHLLDNNINQLKESFSSKGINIEGFSVSVGEDSQSNNKKNFHPYKKRTIEVDSEDLKDNDYLTIISNNYQESYIENGSLDIKA